MHTRLPIGCKGQERDKESLEKNMVLTENN